MAGATREDKRVGNAYEKGYQSGRADMLRWVKNRIQFVREKSNRHWTTEKVLDEIEKQISEISSDADED